MAEEENTCDFPNCSFDDTKHILSLLDLFAPNTIRSKYCQIGNLRLLKIFKYATSFKLLFIKEGGNAPKKNYEIKGIGEKFNAELFFILLGVLETLLCTRTPIEYGALFIKALKNREEWKEPFFSEIAISFVAKDANPKILEFANLFEKALDNRVDPKTILIFENQLRENYELLSQVCYFFYAVLSTPKDTHFYKSYLIEEADTAKYFTPDFYRSLQELLSIVFMMKIPIIQRNTNDYILTQSQSIPHQLIKPRFSLIDLGDKLALGYNKKSTLLLFTDKAFMIPNSQQFYSEKEISPHQNIMIT